MQERLASSVNKRIFRALVRAWSVLVLAVGLGIPLQAQELPTPAEPGRETPQFFDVPSGDAFGFSFSIEIPGGTRPPPDMVDVTLLVEDVILDGVSIYDTQELRALYEDRLGREMTLGELFAIAGMVEQYYREDDYLLSFAYFPEQESDDGTFRLQVVEGFVSQVVIRGATNYVRQRLQAMLDRITDARPLTNSAIERYLLLATEIAGIEVSAVLHPAEVEGASDLIVTVEETPLSGSASLHNQNSRYTGRWVQRTSASLATGLWGVGEELTASVSTTTDFNESRNYQLSYDHPIGSDGLKLEFDISYGASSPGLNLDQFDISSQSTNVKAAITYPLIKSRENTLQLSAALRARDTYTDADILGVGERSPLTRDHIRMVDLQLTYSHLGLFGGASLLNLNYFQGIEGLGGDESSLSSRADAEAGFKSLLLVLAHTQPIWDRLAFSTFMSGAYAFDPLYSGLEMTVGGKVQGRGYDPGEITGDDGWAVANELVYTLRPGQIGLTNDWFRSLQFFGFYDFGITWQKSSATAEAVRRTLASAGGGLRARLPLGVSVDFLVAQPLTRPVSTESGRKPTRFLLEFSIEQ